MKPVTFRKAREKFTTICDNVENYTRDILIYPNSENIKDTLIEQICECIGIINTCLDELEKDSKKCEDYQNMLFHLEELKCSVLDRYNSDKEMLYTKKYRQNA